MKMNNVLAKAVLNGFISWIMIAVVIFRMHTDISFTQAVLSLNAISLAAACAMGSYFGFMLKAERG